MQLDIVYNNFSYFILGFKQCYIYFKPSYMLSKLAFIFLDRIKKYIISDLLGFNFF